MSRAAPHRKPWPMKWIVLAILLFIGGYTYLTLHYRRPGKAYEPYADMKNRANTGRLLAAGFQRVELVPQKPADSFPQGNTAMPAPGGLPAELRTTIVALPLLPAEVDFVHAAGSGSAAAAYPIAFRCVAPDDKQQLGGAAMYIKGEQIIITPDFERLTGGLQTRTRETVATLTIPAGTLKPGDYHVTLVGERMSRAWTLAMR